ncbi:hypothetical protein DRZ78_01750 [Candidatus Aerophobetes bacterium]|uniref:Uncharacterized protein n=1 Tax=Aerophobetes bacterium TaxID=2030807 RepID=A0A662D559_UNCAE|nr:MAG: hypothetical protein DRZ78_01750 [Candidatus Aerophobetes bacterium]
MNEKDYLKERAKKSIIKGLLFEIVREDVDIDQLAQNIADISTVIDRNDLQKAVLGEISNCLKPHVSKSQAVAVSVKIHNALWNLK